LDFTKPGGASEEDSGAGGVAGLFAATAALSITDSNIAGLCSIRSPLSASRVSTSLPSVLPQSSVVGSLVIRSCDMV
jgi:hypothetical protein